VFKPVNPNPVQSPPFRLPLSSSPASRRSMLPSPNSRRYCLSAMAFSSKLLVRTLRSSLFSSGRLTYSSLLSTASGRLPGPLLSLRFCSAAAATADVGAADTAIAAVSASHPWPEWGEFLDKLRAKGYFERPALASGPSDGEGAADATVEAAADNAVASADTYPFKDQNNVKNACLKFARQRYDLFG
jgi:hypothetical protein